MLRYLRYLFLAALGLCLVTVALANRQVVHLKLLPEEIAGFAGLQFDIQLPMFVVVFGGIISGLLIGFVWEWLREARLRAEGDRAKRDAKKLEREVKKLRQPDPAKGDDVLALLDGKGAAR